MKVAVLAPEHVPPLRGGLDLLHDRLAAELSARVVSLPTAEGSLEELVASYRAWAEVDASGFDAVLSTKYPAWMVQHPRHAVWMAHKLRGLFDLYPAHLPLRPCELSAEVAAALEALAHAVRRRAPNREAAALAGEVVEAAHRAQPEAAAFPGPLAREVTLCLDELALGADRIACHAAISRSVARRPGYFPRGAEVRVLHPPLARGALRPGPSGDYLLAVSRLDPPKRLDLVIRAFARVRPPVRLVIAGSGPELERLRAEAGGDRRVELRGFVPDAELADLYAGCRAVVFAPLDEDFGYVCLEAFAAGKPVITTADAGGPAELVEDGASGRVVLPTERALAEAMDWMAQDPARAERMGQAAAAAGGRLRWGPVLEALLPVERRERGRPGRAPALPRSPARGEDDMTRLFPSTETFVRGDPEAHGFYELEPPDNFRWMKQDARCWIPSAPAAAQGAPALQITATGHRAPSFLSVSAGGVFLGTQPVDRYGRYLYPFPGRPPSNGPELEIILRADRAEVAAGDSRALGLAVYGVDTVDLAGGWDAFGERQYLAEQVKVFRSDTPPLPALLDSIAWSSGSQVLDVGAGMGWSTSMLAARTGARVHAVDLHRYDALTGESFRAELLRRMKRHAPLLARQPGLERFAQPEAVVEACSFYTMDAQHLLFRDGAFDFAFSLNAFEHIPAPERALQEISRVLRPGGMAFIKFMPIYHADGGHHLVGLLERPWVHLLHTQAQIEEMIRNAGGVINEVPSILASLNGYRIGQYQEMFRRTDLQVVEKEIHRGFCMGGSSDSEVFRQLRKKFSEEELSSLGMTVVLKKKGR